MSQPALTPGYSRLTLTNETHAPALACAHVVQVARNLGSSDEELAAIELGVEEATANVVRHAFAPGELGSFDIICMPTALGLEIRICDQGVPFDPGQLPAFSPDGLLSLDDNSAHNNGSGGGLGIFLMRQVFDVVIFRNLGRNGKETCLIKYRNHAPIGEYTTPPPTPLDASREIVSSVRRIKPSEAIEVSRCVYEAYGYSYPYEHIYYPERITALNESGEIVSAVAVTPSGRIAGHAALVKDANDGAELAIVVTRPTFRGQGIAQQLGDFLLQEARAIGLQTVFTQAVTSHTYTQQFCNALGFSECALLPGHAPASMQFRNIADHLQQRESCILAVRFLSTKQQRPLVYAPEAHQPLIERLYLNLGIEPLWQKPPASDDAMPDHTEMSVNASSSLGLGIMKVATWGKDCTDILRQHLLQLHHERYAVVQLLLPLWQPACASHLIEVEKIGFFFSGIFPQPSGKDWLVMHYLLDPNIDYNCIHAYSSTAKLLLNYVKNLDPFNSKNIKI
ncbi:GNAT family N-acetyltransferase [Pseudochelatococcus sp. G4_1912]|uniref:GNAT family N-acetyltransferase n=1 Tax=Pseudochelatococcus sp. G4_1912 TaxID=3114288 RepID=UPI0039C710DE